VMLSDFPPAEQDVVAADYTALREALVCAACTAKERRRRSITIGT
jgi:hypothetical protein